MSKRKSPADTDWYKVAGQWKKRFDEVSAQLEDTAKLRAVLQEATDHMTELENAWKFGAISEHDGLGGTRSNRNTDILSKMRRALEKK